MITLSRSSQRMLEAAQACIDAFYAAMFRDWPGAVTQAAGGCTLSYSGDGHLTGANHVWPGGPGALTLAVLDVATRFFAAFHAAWSVIYTDTYTPDAADLLDAHGYTLRWSSPLMALDRPPYRLRVRSGTAAIRATTPDHLRHMRPIMAEAFGTSDAVNRRITRPEHLDDPGVAHYLIYANGTPVSCATVTRCGDVAALWNVGTRRAFRRQRFAATLVQAILDDLAAGGITTSILLASPSGQPLYERLGYRTIGTTMYMAPPVSLFGRA
jgi:ribosomal protein S18 acetylase RimI-like enzyme